MFALPGAITGAMRLSLGPKRVEGGVMERGVMMLEATTEMIDANYRLATCFLL